MHAIRRTDHAIDHRWFAYLDIGFARLQDGKLSCSEVLKQRFVMSVGEEVLIRSRRRSVAVGLLDVGTCRCVGGRRFEPAFFRYETTQDATSVWHPVKRLEHRIQTIGQSNGFRWIVRGCPPKFGAIVRYKCVNK